MLSTEVDEFFSDKYSSIALKVRNRLIE